MLTPNLFYITAITGLWLIGESFTPTIVDKNVLQFDKDTSSFTKYTERFHKKQVDSISDEEHVAFLALWLSKYVFYCRSLQVAKRFISLAHQLPLGHNIFLSELILGSLNESLSEGDALMSPWAGPFWPLQLWLNATFSRNLKIQLFEAQVAAFNDRTTERMSIWLST